MATKIEWCDITINPIVGCSKISLGCQNCYAEKMAWRLKCMGNPKYQDVVDRNGWTGQICGDLRQFHSLPKRPKKVFVMSMGDLFYEKISDGTIALVFYAMLDYPQHTYIILTKRPKRMAFFLKHKISPNRIKEIPNLWLGATVEHPDYLWRLDEILKIPAAVRFVSIEPMLGHMRLNDWIFDEHKGPDSFETQDEFYQRCNERLDWVILGAETGAGARPMELSWARDVRDQCKASGVPFFFKSAGKQETPDDLMVREFPRGG